ncbi:hypothetical protein [Streptomyces sp. NPDC002580]|uniref:hypothetical protein n=1 Tax=Streptomyces sp. NPDC002580 TaxID=3364653 RepID=UPI00367E84C9
MDEIFRTGAELSRSGWFAESLATQALFVFAVRTPRVPFCRRGLRLRPGWSQHFHGPHLAVGGAETTGIRGRAVGSRTAGSPSECQAA